MEYRDALDLLHPSSPYYTGKVEPVRNITRCPLCLNFFEGGVELDEVPEMYFIPEQVCTYCGEGDTLHDPDKCSDLLAGM